PLATLIHSLSLPDALPISNGTLQVVFRDHFFVLEPQANALVRLTRLMRLDVGVGYRLIDGADGVDRRLRGVSGSVALQIGGVSADRKSTRLNSSHGSSSYA